VNEPGGVTVSAHSVSYVRPRGKKTDGIFEPLPALPEGLAIPAGFAPTNGFTVPVINSSKDVQLRHNVRLATLPAAEEVPQLSNVDCRGNEIGISSHETREEQTSK
jgi:hypothetical protein